MPCQDLTPEEMRRLGQIVQQFPELRDMIDKAAPGLRDEMWTVAQQQGLVPPGQPMPPSNYRGGDGGGLSMPPGNRPTDFQPQYDEPRGGPHPMSAQNMPSGQQYTAQGAPEIGAPNRAEPGARNMPMPQQAGMPPGNQQPQPQQPPQRGRLMRNVRA
jgi:hypothetical protein